MSTTASLGQPAIVCHIHPPDQTDGEARIVGSYPSVELCEADNARLYASRGRCHCMARFDLKPSSPPPTREPRTDSTLY
jgi:hypothetical protein